MINLETLRHKLLTKRQEFSLREIAEATGLSRSTLHRIEKGITKKPDWASLQTLALWLGVSAAEVLNAETPITNTDPLPLFVKNLLQNDKNLTPSAQRTLTRLFQFAYNHYSHERIPTVQPSD